MVFRGNNVQYTKNTDEVHKRQNETVKKFCITQKSQNLKSLKIFKKNKFNCNIISINKLLLLLLLKYV